MKKYIYTGIAGLASVQSALARIEPGTNNVRPYLRGNESDPVEAINKFLQWILGFLALIVFIYFLYGGIVILTAAGNDDSVKKGRKVIVHAIIGTVVIFLAWTLTELLFRVLRGEYAGG